MLTLFVRVERTVGRSISIFAVVAIVAVSVSFFSFLHLTLTSRVVLDSVSVLVFLSACVASAVRCSLSSCCLWCCSGCCSGLPSCCCSWRCCSSCWRSCWFLHPPSAMKVVLDRHLSTWREQDYESLNLHPMKVSAWTCTLVFDRDLVSPIRLMHTVASCVRVCVCSCVCACSCDWVCVSMCLFTCVVVCCVCECVFGLWQDRRQAERETEDIKDETIKLLAGVKKASREPSTRDGCTLFVRVLCLSLSLRRNRQG